LITGTTVVAHNLVLGRVSVLIRPAHFYMILSDILIATVALIMLAAWMLRNILTESGTMDCFTNFYLELLLTTG
jgi:hypothetical protein